MAGDFGGLINEIASIPGFLNSSAGVYDVAELRSSQATSLLARIKLLARMDLKVATRLKTALDEVDWTDDERKLLKGAVDEIASQTSLGAAAKSGRRAQQRCPNFELFPTASEWVLLADDATPWSTKYHKIKSICKRIGLLLPAAPTRGRMLESMLLCTNMPIERDMGFFKQLDRLTETLDPLQKEPHYAAGHLVDFPNTPDALSKDHFELAYATEPPAKREFRELGGLTRDVRKSSNAYKKAIEPDGGHLCTVAPRTNALEAMGSIAKALGSHSLEAPNPLQAMGVLLAAQLQHAQGMGQRNSGEINSHMGKEPPKQVPMKDAETQSPSPPRARHSSVSVGGSSMDASMEPPEPADADAALKAEIRARAPKVKPQKPKGKCTKAKAKAKGKGTARAPKAKATIKAKGKAEPACMKRPAANVIYVPLKAIPWTADDAKRSRNTFACMWYGRVKRSAANSGYTGKRLKGETSRVLILAGSVWDQNME